MSQTITFPMPIVIKEELVSDSEEVHCRLCHKAFASAVALNNHARMDHIEAYENGDPTVWTKSEDDIVVRKKVKSKPNTKKLPNSVIEKCREQIISSIESSSVTGLPSNNVSYIIIKTDESGDVGRRVVKKEHKPPAPKKQKTPQPITGPFECLEPSPLGADGACHQIFFSCCEYSAHARADHSRRRRAPRCQVCERPLPSRPGDKENPYACELCTESFPTAEALLAHTGAAHVKHKPYECGVCHKRFTQQGGVLQHMRMHTGDRPFPCTFCNKAFTQKSGLDQHLRTHTKHKPYKCVVCTKAFIQSVHLKQHMRTHTNVAPFQCGICDKRFKQSSHLNYHLKNHNPANMTAEQRSKFMALVGQVAGHHFEVESNEVEMDSQEEEMTEEMEQVLAEQSLIEGEYIIGDTYEG